MWISGAGLFDVDHEENEFSREMEELGDGTH